MSYRTTFGDLEATERDVLSLPPPNVPMEVARDFADARYRHPSGVSTLQFWRGGWWEWRIARWVEIEQRAMQAAAYRVHRARRLRGREGRQPKPWAPNRHKIADLLDALAAVVHLPEDVHDAGLARRTDARRAARLVRERAARRRHARAARAHPAVLQRDRASRSATTRRPLDPDALARVPGRAVAATTPTSIKALQEWFGYVDLAAGSTCTRSCCWSGRRAAGRA